MFSVPSVPALLARIRRLRPTAGTLVAVALAAVLTAQEGAPATSAPPAPAGPQPSAPAPAGPVPAPASQPEEGKSIDLNMPDTPLMAVLQMLERLTGRFVIRPQSLPSTEGYNIVASKLTRTEAITAIETALALNGIAVTPLGDKFLKVVPIGQARMEAPRFVEGSVLELPPGNQVVTKLFLLQYMRPQELTQLISGNTNQTISAPMINERASAVLFTDTVSNLQFVERLVRQLDRPVTGGLKVKSYALTQGAKASDVVTKIRTILQSSLGNQPTTAVNLNADDRTNTVFLTADPGEYPFFDDLIAKLDVKAEPNTRNEVIYLKAAVAKDVATLLSNLISGRNQAASRSGQQQPSVRSGQFATTPTPPATPNQPANVPPATPPAVASLLAEAGQGSDFSERLTVVAEERSNAIVVSGTVDDIRLIKELVAKIDVLLAQVRIAVIIVEVTLKDTDKSGLSALNLTVGTDATAGTRISNFAGNVAGWDVTGGVVAPTAFQAALSNTGSRSNVKILSNAYIMTAHNTEGRVVVGQSQPIITGSQSTIASTGTTPITTSTVTYKDIAIDLKVTPLIGNDGSVQLKIDQVVDDIVGNVTIDNNQQPIIGRRQATSFVNVKDGEMIVLGGLQRNKRSADRTKIGFLREIPIISHLFGARENDLERTELLLFIRPHVIGPDEGTADANQQIDQLSNKDQVRVFLENPGQVPKESLKERLK